MVGTLQTYEVTLPQVRDAQLIFKRDRRRGFAALNEIFRAGSAPNPPLDGRYVGKLLAFDTAPGLNEFVEFLMKRWMPWRGKFFDASGACGDNIFTQDSLTLAHLYWPLYHAYRVDGAGTYRAFTFHTRIAPGKDDSDRQVLKLDYDLAGNPRLSIRRVLDELVQIDTEFYLGKAHLKWLWGKWQMVAYFSLARDCYLVW